MPVRAPKCQPNPGKPEVCYGKFDDLKRGAKCEHRSKCELGATCLSASRESGQELHWRYQNIYVPELLFDPNDDDNSNSTQPAFIGETLVDPELDEDLDADMAGERNSPGNDDGSLMLGEVRVPVELRPALVEIVREIDRMLREAPRTLDMLFSAVLRGQRQSDRAKELGMTRAWINKWLLRELNISQKRSSARERIEREMGETLTALKTAVDKAKSAWQMTEAELTILKTCMQYAKDNGESPSVTIVASLTGYSRKHIYTTLHNLRDKYHIEVTLSPYAKNKKRRKIENN